MRLKDRVALITGGASGIGAATARKFIMEGARVAIADLQEQKGHSLVAQLGDAACYVPLDVTSPAGWEKAIENVRLRFGGFTTLVNSAGVSLFANIEQETIEGFRRMTTVNLEGTFLACKYGIAALKHTPNAAIVTVTSTLAVRTAPHYLAYSASKAASRMVMRAAALHCAEQKYSVRINAVLPGPTHTEMVEAHVEAGMKTGASRESVLDLYRQSVAFKRLGEPCEVASAIAFLASDEASFITGVDLPVDGGSLAL
jgi:NAD(P)-dependent dehydrogenase (short-subunit alcohol dehydrogenase family)